MHQGQLWVRRTDHRAAGLTDTDRAARLRAGSARFCDCSASGPRCNSAFGVHRPDRAKARSCEGQTV